MIKKINFPFGILFLVSFFALSFAYIIQFSGHKPCALCLYQRVPYFLIIIISVLGFYFKKNLYKKIAFYSCLALLASNAVLAFYHSGVEKKVFTFHEKCEDLIDGNLSSVLELQNALASVPARCDEPSFVFLNLSMASWNFIYCLTILIILFINLSSVTNRHYKHQ